MDAHELEQKPGQGLEFRLERASSAKLLCPQSPRVVSRTWLPNRLDWIAWFEWTTEGSSNKQNEGRVRGYVAAWPQTAAALGGGGEKAEAGEPMRRIQ